MKGFLTKELIEQQIEQTENSLMYYEAEGMDAEYDKAEAYECKLHSLVEEFD